MKDLLPIACLIALGACSAEVKREPAPLDPTTPATTSSTTPAAPTQCPALQIKAPDSVPAGQVGQVTLILTDTGGTPTYAWA